jgi:hypothetical protein
MHQYDFEIGKETFKNRKQLESLIFFTEPKNIALLIWWRFNLVHLELIIIPLALNCRSILAAVAGIE